MEKENKDCHEMYPQIHGEGLAYKMSTYVISIPNVTLATRYLPMQKQQTRCQQHVETKYTVSK